MPVAHSSVHTHDRATALARTFCMVALLGAAVLTCGGGSDSNNANSPDTLPPIGPGTRKSTLLPEDTPGSQPPGTITRDSMRALQ